MARFASFLLILACAGLAAPGQAAADPAALCDRAIASGAARGGVPVDVLRAIALTETGRNGAGGFRAWPWAVNREGQGHWFRSREEALAFAKASVAAGRRSFDVGCFQINYHWHGHNFPSLEAMFDQEIAGAYAARFLRSLEGELGSWSRAAGAYHSRTPAFAERYRARFDRILAGLGGAPLVLAEAGPEADAAGAGEGEAAPPRKSRTRMSARPKIISLAPAPVGPDPVAEKVAAIRIERGRVPKSVAEALAPQPPVAAVSARDAPL